jgi:hypothetical protein
MILHLEKKNCRNYIGKVRRLRLGTGDAEAIEITNTHIHVLLFIGTTAYKRYTIINTRTWMNRYFWRWDSKMIVVGFSASQLYWFNSFRSLILFELSRSVFLESRILCGADDVTVSVRVWSSLSVCFSALFQKGIVAVLMLGLCNLFCWFSFCSRLFCLSCFLNYWHTQKYILYFWIHVFIIIYMYLFVTNYLALG